MTVRIPKDQFTVEQLPVHVQQFFMRPGIDSSPRSNIRKAVGDWLHTKHGLSVETGRAVLAIKWNTSLDAITRKALCELYPELEADWPDRKYTPAQIEGIHARSTLIQYVKTGKVQGHLSSGASAPKADTPPAQPTPAIVEVAKLMDASVAQALVDARSQSLEMRRRLKALMYYSAQLADHPTNTKLQEAVRKAVGVCEELVGEAIPTKRPQDTTPSP